MTPAKSSRRQAKPREKPRPKREARPRRPPRRRRTRLLTRWKTARPRSRAKPSDLDCRGFYGVFTCLGGSVRTMMDKPQTGPDYGEPSPSREPLRVFVAEDNAADVF